MPDQSIPVPGIDEEETFPEWVTVVGLKIRDQGEVKVAQTTDLSLKTGDHVLLDLENDTTYGTVFTPPHPQPFLPPMRVMRSILRKATPEDEAAIARQQELSSSGIAFCRERAQALGEKKGSSRADVFGNPWGGRAGRDAERTSHSRPARGPRR